jgi:hypothetical protein
MSAVGSAWLADENMIAPLFSTAVGFQLQVTCMHVCFVDGGAKCKHCDVDVDLLTCCTGIVHRQELWL